MKLEAMVPQSVFNDVLAMIRPSELSVISMAPLGFDDRDVPTITVEMSAERMLEVAKLTSATVGNPEGDYLPEFDRLYVENHIETGGWRFDSYNGQINIWLENCAERL